MRLKVFSVKNKCEVWEFLSSAYIHAYVICNSRFVCTRVRDIPNLLEPKSNMHSRERGPFSRPWRDILEISYSGEIFRIFRRKHKYFHTYIYICMYVYGFYVDVPTRLRKWDFHNFEMEIRPFQRFLRAWNALSDSDFSNWR